MMNEKFRVPFSSEDFWQLSQFFAYQKGTALLYSGGSYACSTKSLLFLFPIESFAIGKSLLKHTGEAREIESQLGKNWDLLEEALGSFHGGLAIPKWVGYLSYELGLESDLDKRIEPHHSPLPIAYFQRCSLVFVFENGGLSLFVAEDYQKIAKEEQIWVENLSDLSFWPSFLQDIRRLENRRVLKDSVFASPITSEVFYQDKICQIQELIREGEVYQVNLSHEVSLKGKEDPFAVFSALVKENPAPFMAYFYWEDFSIVSSSPERLLQKRNDRLSTRPIKGTVSRGKTEREDQILKKHLLSSEKERAELLMITDLSRNDLGKVSEKDSVSVDDLFLIEAYTNVFHMLSNISSCPERGRHPAALLRSSFPGGSISGCPKLRAQEVIAELEGEARGIYTGSLGYFCVNGDFDFNIAIRTLLMERDRTTFRLGGAIVIDSDSSSEYLETLHKGKTIFEIFGLFIELQ